MASTVSISVVFTDLVGSTAAAARLGPAASEQLRQTHLRLLRSAVRDSGGTEVKNLGDGLMVVFPSAGGALAGAVAMQQAIERHNRTAQEPLRVRIGASSGDVVEDDGDYFGDPVVEAARLCMVADGGEILATRVTTTIARWPPASLVRLGALDLKGLPAPVESVRVRWEPPGSEPPIALPPRLEATVASTTVVVGREREAAHLHEAFGRVRQGEQRVVLVAGEPGVGKTTLVTQVAEREHHDGAIVLYGRCDEDIRAPYEPWVEALAHLVDEVPLQVLDDHVARHGGQLCRMVPNIGQRLPHLEPTTPTDPETERYLLYRAVMGLVAAAAELAPTIVVLDDLHWADAPTLTLLRQFATTPTASPLLLVGTYRDTEVDREHELASTLAALWRAARSERLQLTGLDHEAVEALVASHPATIASDADLATALWRETNGNPFFTWELLRDLAESGALEDGRVTGWQGDGGTDGVRLPESVREVVELRVERIGEDAHAVLSAASVIGREFELSVLARVLERTEDDVLGVLERAVAASVIEELDDRSDAFAFRHALLQRAMSADLSHARRRRLHRRIAEAIEGEHPADERRVGELAAHWLAATAPVDAQKAIRYARLAGEQALAALAPDEALRWFRHALEVMDPADEERARLLVSIGVAERQAGDPGHRATLLEAARLARGRGDTATLVEAALANNRGYHSASGQTDVERLEVLEAALAAVGTDDSPERALLLATLCAEMLFEAEPPRLQELFDEALATARRLGDDRIVVEVTSRTRVAVGFPETVAQRLEVLTESRRLADEIEDPVLCFHAAQALLWVAAESADRATVDREIETMVAIADRTGQPTLQWLARYTLAMRAAMAGDTEGSERLAEEALTIGLDSGQPDALTFYGGQLFRIRQMQGRLQEMVPMLAEMREQNPGLPVFRAVHALACAHSGDLTLARSLLDQEMALGFGGRHDMQWSTGVVLWAETASRLGHQGAGAALHAELEPFDRTVAFTGLTDIGPFAHYLGELGTLLGRYSDADRHFAVAAEIEDRSVEPFMRALTHLGHGRLLAVRGGPGDAAAAAAELTAAREVAVERGYGLVERDARDLLASLPAERSAEPQMGASSWMGDGVGM